MSVSMYAPHVPAVVCCSAGPLSFSQLSVGPRTDVMASAKVREDAATPKLFAISYPVSLIVSPATGAVAADGIAITNSTAVRALAKLHVVQRILVLIYSYSDLKCLSRITTKQGVQHSRPEHCPKCVSQDYLFEQFRGMPQNCTKTNVSTGLFHLPVAITLWANFGGLGAQCSAGTGAVHGGT